MSAKNTVTVVIGGKVTKLSGYESEEYLQRVAAYLNHKMNELSELKGWNRMTAEMKNTLLALNIADDYFKARNQAEVFDEDLQNKDKELYELKQQIVELQMELDELTSPDPPTPSNDRYRSSRKH
ncbi:MAG: cell division protein ZapA [Lachnospiraceae bacterium]|nr:cell division protein ZapA [Lachnospiraceae bacterium]